MLGGDQSDSSSCVFSVRRSVKVCLVLSVRLDFACHFLVRVWTWSCSVVQACAASACRGSLGVKSQRFGRASGVMEEKPLNLSVRILCWFYCGWGCNGIWGLFVFKCCRVPPNYLSHFPPPFRGSLTRGDNSSYLWKRRPALSVSVSVFSVSVHACVLHQGLAR